MGSTVHVPPAPVRSASLELAEHVDPAALGGGATWCMGCVVALIMTGAVLVVELLAAVGWTLRWGQTRRCGRQASHLSAH